MAVMLGLGSEASVIVELGVEKVPKVPGPPLTWITGSGTTIVVAAPGTAKVTQAQAAKSKLRIREALGKFFIVNPPKGSVLVVMQMFITRTITLNTRTAS
jgi:hypothetical protein